MSIFSCPWFGVVSMVPSLPTCRNPARRAKLRLKTTLPVPPPTFEPLALLLPALLGPAFGTTTPLESTSDWVRFVCDFDMLRIWSACCWAERRLLRFVGDVECGLVDELLLLVWLPMSSKIGESLLLLLLLFEIERKVVVVDDDVSDEEPTLNCG